MNTTIINLTPHTINFILPNGEKMEIPASGNLARVSVHTETVGEINGIPITTSVFGEVEGLPAFEDGVVYIVSSLVAQRCGDRKDIFIPNESVRDENGRIIGCRSLGRI
jgi:hypothetical protein